MSEPHNDVVLEGVVTQPPRQVTRARLNQLAKSLAGRKPDVLRQEVAAFIAWTEYENTEIRKYNKDAQTKYEEDVVAYNETLASTTEEDKASPEYIPPYEPQVPKMVPVKYVESTVDAWFERNYSMLRQNEYIDIEEQLDNISKALEHLATKGIDIGEHGTKQVTMIHSVKDKYPKPQEV